MAKISALADLLETHGLNLWFDCKIDNRKSLKRNFYKMNLRFNITLVRIFGNRDSNTGNNISPTDCESSITKYYN